MPLQHDRLLRLINGVELPAVADLSPKWHNPPDLNLGCWGPHFWLNKDDYLTLEDAGTPRFAQRDGVSSCCSIHFLMHMAPSSMLRLSMLYIKKT